MSIFKNKHVRIAIVLAPVLGVVSYYATRDLGTEAPHAAKEGQSYQLAEKPNCRRASGVCGLKNGDFELNLSMVTLGDDHRRLMLRSAFPLDGVVVAVVKNQDEEKQPVDMLRVSEDGLQWSLELPRPDPERERLRLVASANRSLYFGDVATKFTLRETGSQ